MDGGYRDTMEFKAARARVVWALHNLHDAIILLRELKERNAGKSLNHEMIDLDIAILESAHKTITSLS